MNKKIIYISIFLAFTASASILKSDVKTIIFEVEHLEIIN